MELQKAGAAVVIEEKDLTGEKLVHTVSAMLAQPGKLAEMGKNARSLSVDEDVYKRQVQEIAERYLNEAIAANTVENRGCAIVMDVKTGAIPVSYTHLDVYKRQVQGGVL